MVKPVNRPILDDLPLESDWAPSDPAVDNLCFVTIGGGDRVYADMLECLASLRASRRYRQHPLFIVDTGLTESQRRELDARFNVSGFHNPEKQFTHVGERHRSWLSIAWFPTFFPEFEYYFHLECDTWIQDERTIDKHVALAEKQGWAMDGFNVGIYCLREESGFGQQWREEVAGDPRVLERTAHEVYRKRHLNFLKNVDGTRCPSWMFHHTRPAGPLGLRNNMMVWHTGLPLCDENGILVDPIALKPVGIFHPHARCEFIRAGNAIVYTRQASEPLDEANWKRHIASSRIQLQHGPDKLAGGTGSLVPISMRYRQASD